MYENDFTIKKSGLNNDHFIRRNTATMEAGSPNSLVALLHVFKFKYVYFAWIILYFRKIIS